MKLFALLTLTALTSLPALAQQTCYVDMVDRYGRVVATYTAWDDPRVCQEGMKQCRKAIRLEPHLGGVDCIKEGAQPQPQPIPVPVPQPQPPRPQPIPHPQPAPYPQPQPVPYPRPVPQPWGHIEVAPLIQDLVGVVWNAEKQTKIIESLIQNTGSHALAPFISICNGTRTWAENSQCLLSGVQRAPRELISEDVAIHAVGKACTLTPTWAEEKSCFEAALKGTRLQSLDYYAQSCSQMWQAESSAKCFRQIFGVR